MTQNVLIGKLNKRQVFKLINSMFIYYSILYITLSGKQKQFPIKHAIDGVPEGITDYFVINCSREDTSTTKNYYWCTEPTNYLINASFDCLYGCVILITGVSYYRNRYRRHYTLMYSGAALEMRW
jgi:hypothetical protein